MMSGAMSTSAKSEETPVTRLPDRARWLASLTDAEREVLSEMPLREVDERFTAWLEREPAEDGRPPG